MNISSRTGTQQEVAKKEHELLAKGYHRVRKPEKSLLPGEYTKSSFTGSATSFEGPGGWTLTWSPMPGDQ